MKKKITIYCGAAYSSMKSICETAKEIGKYIATQQWTLIYGGGNSGLMGTIAQAAIENQGKVIGIITKHLEGIEGKCDGVERLEVVATMAERKKKLFDYSDILLVLPGGVGTLDEFFDNLVGHKIDLHTKPIIIFNHEDFWTPLIKILDHLVEHNFVKQHHLRHLHIANNLDQLTNLLQRL
jgi:uncharacterized protein (TIGR00730 family)